MLTRLSAMYVQARLLAFEERRRAADEHLMERDHTQWARRRARKEALIAVPA